ncbi:hypothetical protein [Streptomyces sp. 3N207]|uniref:hypothetical protein n=1 Tax=Streptomyces sp. 3N207 TaxID=3457417 RepID=UPI003FD1AD97
MPGKRILAICGVMALVIAGSMTWWLQGRGEENLGVPEKVCNESFSGDEVEPLFPSVNGELDSLVRESFPGPFENTSGFSASTSCEMTIDGHGVSFRVSHPSYSDPPGRMAKEYEYIAELGDVYGAYFPRGGTLRTVVRCPVPGNERDKLVIVTGADVAERGSDAYEGFDKGVGKLAQLSGYATRTLARKVYKCKGAGEIPRGPVRIKPGKGGS